MRIESWRSDLTSIRIHKSGWYRTRSGSYVTRLPLWDSDQNVFASIGHGVARSLLAPHGMRIPMVTEHQTLHAEGVHIEPFTLPTPAMLREAGVNIHSESAINAFRTARMMGLDWRKLSTRVVLERLAAVGFELDGDGGFTRPPADSALKHWCGDLIHGWWTSGGGLIQPASGFHKGEPTYSDYGSGVHAWTDLLPTRHAGDLLIGEPDESWIEHVFSPLVALGESLRDALGLLGPSWDDAPPTKGAGAPAFMEDELTPASTSEVFLALGRAWQALFGAEPARESLVVLCAQWAIETGWGKSCHRWNLGNIKGRPGGSDGHSWTFFGCNEIVPSASAARYVARAGTRTDGKPGADAVITSSRGGASTIWFYPSNPGSCFRAYPSLDEGAADYLALLHRRFARAWPSVVAGDPAGFGHALKASGYYTAPEQEYVAGLSSIVRTVRKRVP